MLRTRVLHRVSMCGIVGVDRTWRDDRAAFDAALGSLSWRGPDGEGRAEAGRWRLGVRRLAITDASTPQPMRCLESGRIALWNGADTGAAEDRAALRMATGNDTELLLARMVRGGAASIPPRHGHGAGVVVDPQRDALWLFRDPCGEKPLFCATLRGRLVAFASTWSALRALGVDARPTPPRMGAWVRTGFGTGAWQGDGEGLTVAALDEAAACLRPVALDRAQVYAQIEGQPLEPVAADPGRRLGEGEGEPGSFAATLEDAAARCAATEVPAALSLSGGIDSACIAAALARRGTRLTSYQFWGGGDDSERQRALAVAAHLRVPLVQVDGDAALLEALPRLTAWVGQPLGDPSVLAAHAVARAAAADGHKVLLSGEGADEYWLGYRRQRLARRLAGAGGRAAARAVGALGLRRRASRGLGLGALARVRRALAAWEPYPTLLQVAPPAFVERVFDAASLSAPVWPEPPTGLDDPLARAAFFDQNVYLREDLLPKLDAATMAAGVEGRCPFLDVAVRRLAVRAMRRPAGVLSKRPLRAFESDLPPGFFDQRKRGFAVPLDRWLRADENLLLDVLRDGRTRQRPHLRPGGLGAMLDLHRRGDADLGHALYLVAALELALREEERSCA